ncbi:hypothetical protein [Adhaeribacter soli]|nr:hypothetical protein [Adhaeribacter soli]
MLLIHLGAWALLQVAPASTGYVVFKKECVRSETRATLLAAQKPQNSEQQLSLPASGETDQPAPEVKVCLSKLAPPPLALSLAVLPLFTKPETAPFQPVYYHSLFTSEEPDPPRFA